MCIVQRPNDSRPNLGTFQLHIYEIQIYCTQIKEQQSVSEFCCNLQRYSAKQYNYL